MNPQRSIEVIERLSAFLTTPFEEVIRRRLSCDPQENALRLFQSCAARIPAYAKFLASHHVSLERVKSFADFQSLPLTDKANYMQAYPLPERCKDGRLVNCDRLAVSSGSTGVPTFWPRGMVDELDVALRFEQVFRRSFQAHEQDTLAVVCFPLGNWVGGVFTASCCWHLAQKGYPMTVATPGNKVDEILRVVRELGSYFRQVVLLGYPPFVMDVVDAGIAQDLDWGAYAVKFVFAGEVFSEEWRNLMMAKVGAVSPCFDAASLYGTADGGVLGNETPVSIAIRRILANNPSAARQLFGESRLPTLVQYDPISRFFELVDGKTLAVTGDNGVPLIRYHIADQGGLMGYGEMMDFLRDWGLGSLKEQGVESEECSLPFVWVFGRADFTVSFYGANVYPENVKTGLEQPEFSDWITGKFVMDVCEEDGCESLHIIVEMGRAVAGKILPETIAQSIKAHLLRLNSEFANYVPVAKQLPNIELRPYGDSAYFPEGVKHRYTRGR